MFMVLMVFVLMLMTMVVAMAAIADVFTHMALVPFWAGRAHSVTITALWNAYISAWVAKTC